MIRSEDGGTLVSFIPSGSVSRGPGAMEYSRAAEVLGTLKQDFDLVIVDSAPLLAINEAELLGSAVDAIVLVAGAGDFEEERALWAKERMDRTGATIVGDALDRYDESRHGTSAFPYQRYDIREHELRHP